MSTTHQTETRTDHSIRVAVALGAEVTRDPADATEYTGRGLVCRTRGDHVVLRYLRGVT